VKHVYAVFPEFIIQYFNRIYIHVKAQKQIDIFADTVLTHVTAGFKGSSNILFQKAMLKSCITKNEFQFHIINTIPHPAHYRKKTPSPVARPPWRRSVLPPPEESSTGERSWPSLARAFLREAEAFSAYVSQRWGLAAGSVSSVTPE
jgi:hypothetical protein